VKRLWAALLAVALSGCFSASFAHVRLQGGGSITSASLVVGRGRHIIVLPDRAAVSTHTDTKLVELMKEVGGKILDILPIDGPLPPKAAHGPGGHV